MSISQVNISTDSGGSGESEVNDSLRDELKSISDIVSKLKNFKPETISTPVKKGKGRPKSASKKDIDSITDIIGKICDLNCRILDKVDKLENRNKLLNEELSNTITPKVPTSSERPTPTRKYPPSFNCTKIEEINSRLDHVEQEKLLDTIKFEGDYCSDLINGFLSAPTRDYSTLKNNIVSTICDIESDIIRPQDITKINIVGTEKKHLRVKLSSSSIRVKIHKAVKKRNTNLRANSESPTLFTNDYLTPPRSKIAYDLRKLKRAQPDKIKSTYIFNGNVCCVLMASDRILHINSTALYSDLTNNLQRTNE